MIIIFKYYYRLGPACIIKFLCVSCFKGKHSWWVCTHSYMAVLKTIRGLGKTFGSSGVSTNQVFTLKTVSNWFDHLGSGLLFEQSFCSRLLSNWDNLLVSPFIYAFRNVLLLLWMYRLQNLAWAGLHKKRSSFIISLWGHEMNNIQKSHSSGPLSVLSCSGKPGPVHW